MVDETEAQEAGRKQAERGENNTPDKQVDTVDGSEHDQAYKDEMKRQEAAR